VAAARQYAGGGSPASGSGCGQEEVFDPQQVFVFVSQHCTPPVRRGQLFAQSESVLHDGAHFFSGGGGGVVLVDAGGSFVSGGGSVGAVVSSRGTSALFAHAAAASARRTAVTANADFEKVRYFTVRGL
jgi:hypothetical protein